MVPANLYEYATQERSLPRDNKAFIDWEGDDVTSFNQFYDYFCSEELIHSEKKLSEKEFRMLCLFIYWATENEA